MSRIQHIVVVSRYDDKTNLTRKVGTVECQSMVEARQLTDSLTIGPFGAEHCVRIMHHKGRILLSYSELEYIAKDIEEAMSFRYKAVDFEVEDAAE